MLGNLGGCASSGLLVLVPAPHTHNTKHILWMEQRKARDSLSVRLFLLSLDLAVADLELV